MSRYSINAAIAVLIAVVFVSLRSPINSASAAQQPAVTRKVLLQQDLAIAGYTAAMVSVEIPAGGREGRHTHPGTVIVHVQEGSLTLDYEGKPTATYNAGQTFSVEPGKIHEGRSEEHTSELQSHSEISYAVFCLKKKK